MEIEEENKQLKEITEVKKEKKSIRWAVSSLVTGILSLLLFLMPYFGLPLAIFAIVANHMQNKIKPNGMASAGFVCGILGIIINVITGIFVGIAFLVVAGTTGTY